MCVGVPFVFSGVSHGLCVSSCVGLWQAFGSALYVFNIMVFLHSVMVVLLPAYQGPLPDIVVPCTDCTTDLVNSFGQLHTEFVLTI